MVVHEGLWPDWHGHGKHKTKHSKHGTDISLTQKVLDCIPKDSPQGPFPYLATESLMRQNTKVQLKIHYLAKISNHPSKTPTFYFNNSLLQKHLLGACCCCFLLSAIEASSVYFPLQGNQFSLCQILVSGSALDWLWGAVLPYSTCLQSQHTRSWRKKISAISRVARVK